MQKLKLSFVALALVLSVMLSAQTADRPLSLGIGGAKTTYNGEIGNSFLNFDEEFQASIAARLGLYLSPSFDLAIDGSHGRYGLTEGNQNFLSDMTQGALNLQYKFANGNLFAEDALIRPFITAGVGIATFDPINGRAKSGTSLQVPVGIGAKLYLTDGLNVWWNSRYGILFEDGVDRLMTEEGDDSYLQHTLGLALDLGNGADTDGDGVRDNVDMCPDVPGLKEMAGCPDSDGDGIKDSDDSCPLVAGKLENLGCPDSDGDGIVDKDDKCPNVAGLQTLMGCPDADGDGIADGDDDCPNAAGTAATRGCPDSDGDGVADNKDKCPQVAGVASLSGCPDSDGDGIADGDDRCPQVAGVRSASGCPDADGDGVADADDKCPSQKGPASNNGCPADPDTDGDGVVDRLDRCPETPGLKSNNGCPQVKEEVKQVMRQALEGVFFETSSARIKTESYAVLDNVVTVMQDNPSFQLLISGHTDSRGDDEMNRDLSQKRADSVRQYLINKGVDRSRMRAVGFGETQPVASNDTSAGRAKNRRVEFTVEFK